jgi:hypothetical protein
MVQKAPAMVTKKSSYPLDAAPKPYYCESKIRRRSRLATTALLGLAPVRSARALPPTTQETSAHARLDDSGEANRKVTSK